MKKLYKIILLLFLFIFLTTYNPSEFYNSYERGNSFFKVEKIEIVNNRLIEKNIIEVRLNSILKRNILFIKKNDLEKPLKSLDFLEKIEVKKKYPNTLIIKVYESKPIAILFKKNKKYLLDNLSKLIVFDEKIATVGFPNIYGENAEKYFVNFLSQLEKNNFPKKRIKNYYYFQIGRWDLQLKNDQIIKFPPTKIAQAVQHSIKLLNRKDFANYKVIDLRIHDKIVVE